MMDKIALILLIIGGLNWGSVGIFQFDIVALDMWRSNWNCQSNNLYTCCSLSNMVYITSF